MIELMADATGDEDILTQVAAEPLATLLAVAWPVFMLDELGNSPDGTGESRSTYLGLEGRGRDYSPSTPGRARPRQLARRWCGAQRRRSRSVTRTQQGRLSASRRVSPSALGWCAHRAMGPVDGFLALAASAAGDTARAASTPGSAG